MYLSSPSPLLARRVHLIPLVQPGYTSAEKGYSYQTKERLKRIPQFFRNTDNCAIAFPRFTLTLCLYAVFLFQSRTERTESPAGPGFRVSECWIRASVFCHIRHYFDTIRITAGPGNFGVLFRECSYKVFPKRQQSYSAYSDFWFSITSSYCQSSVCGFSQALAGGPVIKDLREGSGCKMLRKSSDRYIFNHQYLCYINFDACLAVPFLASYFKRKTLQLAMLLTMASASLHYKDLSDGY